MMRNSHCLNVTLQNLDATFTLPKCDVTFRRCKMYLHKKQSQQDKIYII